MATFGRVLPSLASGPVRNGCFLEFSILLCDDDRQLISGSPILDLPRGKLCIEPRGGRPSLAGFDLLLNALLKRPTMQLEDYLVYKQRRQAKFVIYTAISGGFDDLIQHAYVSKDADYVCYTDQVVAHPGIWEIRPLETRHLDRVRSAKYYKMFPHELFPEASYSVWIDGNIDVLTSQLEDRVFNLIASSTVLSANEHFERNCAYEEALVCCRFQLDDLAVISKQLKHLSEHNFPREYGLFEMNMIVRQHHHFQSIALMKSWWDMIVRFSKRDQISFTYVLHQHQTNCEKLFPRNPRFDHDFAYKGHNKKLRSLLYIDTGEGYHQEKTVLSECFVGKDAVFKLVFNINSFMGIRQLRFDPVAGEFCRLQISFLKITFSDGHQQSMRFSEIEALCVGNGKQAADGMMEFDTIDPNITLPLAGDIKCLLIQGQITFVELASKINMLLQLAEQATVTKAANQALGQQLEQNLFKSGQLERKVSELHTTVQAMLGSRTWRAGKALLWFPKMLFKRA